MSSIKKFEKKKTVKSFSTRLTYYYYYYGLYYYYYALPTRKSFRKKIVHITTQHQL